MPMAPSVLLEHANGAIGMLAGLLKGQLDEREPHPDFERAAGYLGAWDGGSELTFGLDGKPMYISGPRDDAERIIRKLQALGEGNYHFTHAISG